MLKHFYYQPTNFLLGNSLFIQTSQISNNSKSIQNSITNQNSEIAKAFQKIHRNKSTKLIENQLESPNQNSYSNEEQFPSQILSKSPKKKKKQKKVKQQPPSLYKTELCRSWEEKGFCKYGNKCQFAHGYHELRSVTRHPKYKTQICKSFHNRGFCPYGKRCRFIHHKIETPDNPLTFDLFSLEQPKKQIPQRLAIFRNLSLNI
ncbi:mRNA decay activator protein zfp36l1 [Anaeramoeba ignava]|uniref:mRNA decay activator protein zfp36l1 n=1 Tax=Anaeramoeba ignava TaxID=1746090 RepID=A0A9Q0LE04_ANAIG|nr:mRNA decay activator protein zfp36l1 [Anaeramoeba ignava]